MSSPWLALLLWMSLGAPPAVAFAPVTHCAEVPEQIWIVGWPAGREAEVDEFEAWVATRTEQIRCPDKLQFQVAYGTDYQLLAWLSAGAIDAALLTPLAVELARRDGTSLRRIVTWRTSRLRLHPESADLATFFAAIVKTEANPRRDFLTVPSHLSNEFYAVLEAAAEHVEHAGLGTAFWPALFDHLCFRPPGAVGEAEPPCALTANEGPEPGFGISIALRSEAVSGPTSEWTKPDPGLGKLVPEWLVVRAPLGEAQFQWPAEPDFPPALKAGTAEWLRRAVLPGPERLADEGPEEAAARHRNLEPLREIAKPDPLLGFRGFRFTVDEALRLFSRREDSRLALVLPGGGVKAAYQTTWLDVLYRQKRLQNRGDGDADRLDVDLVTGTSGGALVGYFAARLGETGPFDLTERLWFPGGQALDAADVFPAADLPRYLSLVVVFVVFSGALLVAGARPRSVFALEQCALARDEAASYRSRPLLAGVATVLLLATPFVVRWVNGESQQEHIPDVEGFLFLVLVLLAMFADQCLVARDLRRPQRSGRVAASLLLVAGSVAVGVPLLAIAPGQPLGPRALDKVSEPVPFWAAFALLAPLFVVPILMGRSRLRGEGTVPGARGFLAGVAEFAAISGGLLASLLSLGALQTSFGPASLFVFGLLLLATLLVFFFRRQEASTPRWQLRTIYFGSLTLAALFLLALTRPPLASGTMVAVLQRESQIDVHLGSLSVSMGSVMLFAGSLFALAAWRGRYRLENVATFALALAIALGHAGLTHGLVWVFHRAGWTSFLELDVEYWWVLLATALVLATFGLVAAALFARGLLREAFCFLAAPHPNGRFRVRRHVRMVHFALFAWGFWNLVVAPGLYGNRLAYDHLESVAQSFGPERAFTVPLLVPANTLEQAEGDGDGSRFFLFVPGDEACPELAEFPPSGGRWSVFRVGRASDEPAPSCVPLDLECAHHRNVVQSMIFASGSPFPVFPAHGVTIPSKPEGNRAVACRSPPEGHREYLIDGGYSNNVPIAPGQNLDIDQVLVIDSSPPIVERAPSEAVQWLRWALGALVNNFVRLPGYLFARAQVLDLQSRREFFVVRVAPHPDHEDCEDCEDWPLLTDFKAKVVKKMTAAAEKDLDRRVARVESWGKPRLVRSWRVGERTGR
ncbi:MAG: hypothetical protein SF066_18025 [Thermoanaerobaculia bacterium]|nr:hypothetical protein [Thermoanaerobaculia bacterium]